MGRDTILGAGQGRHPGALDERGHAGKPVDRQRGDSFDPRLGNRHVPEPIPGHRVGLGEPVNHDGPIAGALERGETGRPPTLEHQARINVVRYHRQAVTGHQAGESLGRRGVERAASRIIRRIEDQDPASGRNSSLDVIDVGGVRGIDAVANRRGADESGHRRIDRKSRIGDQHFVPGADGRQHRVEHGRLGTGRHDDLAGIEPHSAGTKIGRDGLAKFRNAGRSNVPGIAGPEGGNGGLGDMRRGRDIGGAEFEMDDRAAGPFDFSGAAEHVQRSFAGQQVEPGGQVGGHCGPSFYIIRSPPLISSEAPVM